MSNHPPVPRPGEQPGPDDARLRRAFEQLVSTIATHFINLDTEEIDQGIREALEAIGEFQGVGRCSLFRIYDNAAKADLTHEWGRGLGEGRLNVAQAVALDDVLPWVAKKLRKLETLHIPSVADLEREAPEDSAYLQAQGVQAFVAFPVMDDGALVGVLALEELRGKREWSEEMIGLLRVAAELIGSALERQRSESQRRTQEAQMLHAQKLESLGVLAGGIAHDFNNLLAGIVGYADLALDRLESGSSAREPLGHVVDAAKRAAELTKQMLAYSGRGQFLVEPVDLSQLVREMADLAAVSVSKNAVLKYHLAENLPATEADATQIRQVVMNLITNASEAIGEQSGVIAIATGAIEGAEADLTRIHLPANVPQGTCVFLEVRDTGCGMDERTQSRAFDPFFSTKFTGRGLGLAAVLGIVRSHRGAIEIHSTPGRGTTFRVLFPFCGCPVEKSGAAAVPGEPWNGEGTILVVDDEETVRAVARLILEEAGFTVLIAPDGREAVRVFRDHAGRLALVLLDMTMPHLSGRDTFHEMQQINADVPVVLSSGYTEQDATARFGADGLAGFIQKPYRAAELRDVVRRALNA